MNNYKLDNLIDAIGSVSDYVVLESTENSPRMREHNLMKWTTVAASFALFFVMSIVAVFLGGGIGKFITPFSHPSNTTAPHTEPSDTSDSIQVDHGEFSVTVVECGKFDDHKITFVPYAVNASKLDESDKYHIPVWEIRSCDELRALANGLWYEPDPYFDHFTDEFFDDHVLFMAVTSPFSFIRDFSAIPTIESGRLTIEVFYDYEEGIEIPESICVLVSIKKTDADKLDRSTAAYADAYWFAGSAPESDIPINDEEFPDDFAIRFEFWVSSGSKNILDTYENFVQKDLVLGGTSQAAFYADEATRAEIYEKILEYRIFSIDREMTSSVLKDDDMGVVGMDPLTEYAITVTANGRTYEIRGDATADSYTDKNDDADNFMNFVRYMKGLFYDTADYMKFPDAVGGYD